MSAKRAKIAGAMQKRLQAVAVGHKPEALGTPPQESSGKQQTPPSRDGKVPITGFFVPQVRTQLRMLGLELGKTAQEVIEDALKDLFAKHGRNWPAQG